MRKTHVKGRTDCLNDFRKFYKDQRLPIHYTHARIIHEPEKNYYTDTPPTVGKRKTLQWKKLLLWINCCYDNKTL